MSNPILQLLFSDKAIFVFVNTINNDPENLKTQAQQQLRMLTVTHAYTVLKMYSR